MEREQTHSSGIMILLMLAVEAAYLRAVEVFEMYRDRLFAQNIPTGKWIKHGGQGIGIGIDVYGNRIVKVASWHDERMPNLIDF